MQARGAGVPVGNAVGGGVLNVEVADVPSRLDHHCFNSRPAAEGFSSASSRVARNSNCSGITHHDPGQPTGPGGERRISLL